MERERQRKINWCQAKWFARENCGYDFEALKATVPEALASVTNAFIRGFYRLAVRTIDAYSAGLCYGTQEFKHNVYKSHRQVEAGALVDRLASGVLRRGG